MAKIIETKVESRKIVNYYPFWRIILAGFVLGLLEWLFSVVISQFTESATIPGDIATILVATIGIAVLVKLELRQPLIVAIAAAASLWGLAGWISGLSVVESAIWSGLLYGLAYIAFSWIARYKRVVPALILMIVIVVLVRIIALT